MTGAVGLFPAAGYGTRLALASGSKEIVPVPDIAPGASGEIPVGDYLVRQYRNAGIREMTLIRRAPKHDIAELFATAAYADLRITDLVVDPTAGTPQTLDHGCRAAPGRTIAIGFPDIVVDPPTMCRASLARLEASGTDVCLALIRVEETAKWDMMEIDGERVTALHPKPGPAELSLAWVSAVWRPTFSRFMSRWLADAPTEVEASVGHVLRAALVAGLTISQVSFEEGFALDVGTPEHLARARRLVRDRA